MLPFLPLTDEIKEAFKIFGEKAEYLYCRKCDVYASLSDFESSFSMKSQHSIDIRER